jgi:hypothetical protein
MKTKSKKPVSASTPEGNFTEIWQSLGNLSNYDECTIMVPVTVRAESWAMAARGCKKAGISIGDLVSEIVDDAFWQLNDPAFMSLSTNQEEENEMKAEKEAREKQT